MASSILPTTVPGVTSATGTQSTAAQNGTNTKTATDTQTVAANFQQFLTLLTTQLKNQNPLDPMDTNQFTQQLVQFAQVEQQLKSNDQLATLVSLQKTAQSTSALQIVGQTVGVAGDTAPLFDKKAVWTLDVPKVSTVKINIQDTAGQNVFSGSYTMNPGKQNFVWDGKDSSGTQWPDGNYKMVLTATDATGQPVSVTKDIEAQVDSVDLTADPPLLSIAGSNYTLDKVKRVVRTN
ncbi:MAG: flagellar hook capping FlgD N-terminal domain-containing protein [Pseudomonadota bacterium]